MAITTPSELRPTRSWSGKSSICSPASVEGATKGLLLALALTVLPATRGVSQQMAVGTSDELVLATSGKGSVETVSVDGQDLLAAELGAFHPLSVCDVTRGEEFVGIGGEVVRAKEGSVVAEGGMNESGKCPEMTYPRPGDLRSAVSAGSETRAERE